MFKHSSGVVFENRKQCVQVMGMPRYRRALKNGEFEFTNKEQNQSK